MRRWLWAVAVGARLVAALVLLVGPWTDSPAELDGWDVARFQEIADDPGRHWADHPVEYPPGSVVAIEAIAADDEVGTQRALVVLSLLIDLGAAAALERLGRRDAGLVYLLLGLPLVPLGLVRFDLWAVAAAAVGLLALDRRRPATFAAAATVGAAIKVVPGLLVPVAMAARRWREATAAIVTSAAVGVAWLAYGGVDALDQVASLRDVTGWHVESVPGSLLALTTDEQPRLEADAFRIGTIDDRIVAAGRAVTVVVVIGLGWLVRRGTPVLERLALMLLGSTAALVVTAPLLSPQFLLWLTPAAALSWSWPDRRPVWTTGVAIVATAVPLTLFGPPDLDHPVAATLLLGRDLALVAVVVACAQALRTVDGNTRWGTGAPAHIREARIRKSMR